jgi:PAS domain S-box-containing protein
MATSPDYLRLASSSTRAVADAVLDQLSDAVLVIDARHKHLPVVLANAAARQSLVAVDDRAGLIEVPLNRLLTPDSIAWLESALGDLESSAALPKHELTWRMADRDRSAHTDIKLVPGVSSQSLVMLQFASQAQQPSIEDAIHQLPANVLIVDRNLDVTYANALARSTALGSADIVLGSPAMRLIPLCAVHPEVIAGALDGKHFREDALSVLSSNQPTRWFEVDIQPLADEAGKISRLAVLYTEVTERYLNARTQNGGERRLLALTEHARDIISIVSADGRVEYVSGGVRNSLGYTSEERRSNYVFEHMHPDDRSEIRDKFQQLTTGEIEGFSAEIRIRHKDGSYRWLESSYISALNNPLIGGVVINSRDVTERKHAEFRLAQREEVFRLAADAVDGVIFEWDIARGIVNRSRGVQEVLGVEPDEFEASIDAWQERVHPRDFAAARRAVGLALISGRGWTTTYRIRDARGRYKSMLERGLILRNAGGDPLRAIGCCVDVSEIQRLTDILAETQRTAKIGGWEYSFATRELTWTDEMFRIYGTSRQEFETTWESMLYQCVPEAAVQLREALARAESGNGQMDLEIEINTLNGRRVWVRLIGHMERLDGRPFRAYGSVQDIQSQKLSQIALEHDVTERKRLEQEILNVSTRERQSIGRDLHDGLGQELTGVALMLRGLATRIQARCPDVVVNVNEVVSLVNQSIETARGLARGLLPVRTETGGIGSALGALAVRTRELYGLQVCFEDRIAPDFMLDETSASHLYRITQEAVTNAVRHGRAGRVDIVFATSASTFSLQIADDGQGFARATPSSGMGLKIMKYRAGMIGARFDIEANKPQGTLIKVISERAVPGSVQSITAISGDNNDGSQQRMDTIVGISSEPVRPEYR